jgi:plasmid replication initiation protein
MSHALTSAAQSLSLAEKRVMMFAVAKLDVFKVDGGVADGRVKLTAQEYASLFGVDNDTAYNQLKSASDALFERSIQWFEKGANGGVSERVRWVSSAKYNKGAGSVTLRFTPEVRPHLVGLRLKFTTYKLAQASSLRSLYSWRLLELISQNKGLGFRQIDLEEFHHAMETPKGYKANFKDLRQRVIEPAIKELCTKDGWVIDWQPLKTGRKVTGLRFMFKRSVQGVLFED